MRKLAELIDRHGVDVLEHLDRQMSVPVLAGLQAQGDVMVVPARMVKNEKLSPATTAVPATGFPVVRGEVGGNTHLLLAEGTVRFDLDDRISTDSVNLTLGTLTVEENSVAYLAHPEHAYTGVAPGTYQIRRQREQADEIRMVAD